MVASHPEADISKEAHKAISSFTYQTDATNIIKEQRKEKNNYNVWMYQKKVIPLPRKISFAPLISSRRVMAN
jgi:hypothetical protein